MIAFAAHNSPDDDALVPLALAAIESALICVVRHQPPAASIARHALYNGFPIVIHSKHAVVDRCLICKVDDDRIAFVKGGFHAFPFYLNRQQIFRVITFAVYPSFRYVLDAAIATIRFRLKASDASLQSKADLWDLVGGRLVGGDNTLSPGEKVYDVFDTMEQPVGGNIQRVAHLY
ncbi:hypothetical protein ASC94_09135 [Massilia sp. Root418]|nr:hypothetical protein ASC94_09135 [Massilia sp. Root418]